LLYAPVALLPGKESLVPVIRGWVGFRVGLDTVKGKKVKLSLCLGSEEK